MLINIPVSRINPHPQNPRKNTGDITELSDSIRQRGILQNLTVVPQDADEYLKMINSKRKYTGDYTVIIGHRRLEAAIKAGLTEVPCTVATMDERTQIETMLTENIQRSDLTIYEQAQGFQMMLDLGDTVEEVAKRTGFSKATIYRRTKLLELDAAKFAESVERGATFEDYDKLNQIKDPKTRNEALGKIGTANFDWAVKNAIAQETRAENRKALSEILEGFAAKIPEKEANGYQYIKYISYDTESLDVPPDAGSVKYFYTESANSMYLYKERQSQEPPQKSPEEIEREHRFRELRGLFKQAFDLRVEFVKAFKATKEHTGLIMRKAAMILFDGGNSDQDTFRAVFGIQEKIRNPWQKEDAGITFEEALTLAIEKSAGKSDAWFLFAGTYCCSDEAGIDCFNGDAKYRKNESLEDVYDFLREFGYAPSEDERALLDGTHEAYINEQ